MGAHTTRVRVRYEETDQAGVVYHANYLRYFEVGRTEMLRDRGLPYAEIERRGVLLTVVSCQLDFRAPARYDDHLSIETSVGEVRRVRLRLDTRIADEHGKLLAIGHIWLAAVDRSGKVLTLPRELIEVLGPEN